MMVTFPRPVSHWLKAAKDALGRAEWTEAILAAQHAFEQAMHDSDMHGCYLAVRSEADTRMALGEYGLAHQLLGQAFFWALYVPGRHEALCAEVLYHTAENLERMRLYNEALGVGAAFEDFLRKHPAVQTIAFAEHAIEAARREGDRHWRVAFGMMLRAVALVAARDEIIWRVYARSQEDQPNKPDKKPLPLPAERLGQELPEVSLEGADQEEAERLEDRAVADFTQAAALAKAAGPTVLWLGLNIVRLRTSVRWSA
jgi:hypothetical protein